MADHDKKDSDHESPADLMIHRVQHLKGYKAFLVLNNDGVLLRYEHFSHDEALQLACSAISLFSKSRSTMLTLLGKDDGVVETVRIKSKKDELIMVQQGNFTFIVKQSFVEEVKSEGEEGGAPPETKE